MLGAGTDKGMPFEEATSRAFDRYESVFPHNRNLVVINSLEFPWWRTHWYCGQQSLVP
jgi:hypothetical protein